MKKVNTVLLVSLLAVLLIISACSSSETKTQTKNNVPNNGNMEVKLADTSKTILDVADGETIKLTAEEITKTIAGKEIKMYAYNGLVPGVALRVKQNSKISVIFENKLDMETTVHWHGLRHDIKDDGVPDISQKPVMPGESYKYELFFPDAGVFWYHPHIREDLQQDLGLAGNMLVDPKFENYYSPVNREELLVLDDILLDQNGVVPFGEEYANYVLMGRFGNVMLLNGEEKYDLEINKREVIRFYLTNVANTRTFNFHIDGAKLKLVGGDLGKFEREEFVDSVIIAPAERYIIEAYFDKSGKYEIKNINPQKEYLLGEINVLDKTVSKDYSSEFNNLRNNKDVADDLKQFAQYFDKKPDYQIDLTMEFKNGMMQGMMGEGNNMMKEGEMMEGSMMDDDDMMGDDEEMMEEDSMMTDNEMMMGEEHGDEDIEWEDVMPMMNKRLTSKDLTWILEDAKTKKQNMDAGLQAKVGDVIKIRLFNDPDSPHPMQHPIHLHGQRFVVTHIDGVPVENKAWLDTTLVPVGATVDILIDVTNPGEWMMHCHIAEHLEAGMMTSLTVKEA